MHGHLDQDISLPGASWACPGEKCWFLRASDAPEDHGQNDLVVLNRELAGAILARGLPAAAPSLWEPRHPRRYRVGSVANSKLTTHQGPTLRDHAARASTRCTNCACPTTSPRAQPSTWPLRNMCMAS